MSKILLIDDDKTNASLIKLLLEMDGFIVDISSNLDKARQLIDAETAALIIDCNLAMGDNGIDILKEIRKGSTTLRSDTPVIMTSGDDRRADEATEAGASQFLLKPYSPTKLTEELRNLIGQ